MSFIDRIEFNTYHMIKDSSKAKPMQERPIEFEKEFHFIQLTDSRCTNDDNSGIDGDLDKTKSYQSSSIDPFDQLTLVSVMYFNAVNVNANGLCSKLGNLPSTQSVGAFI